MPAGGCCGFSGMKTQHCNHRPGCGIGFGRGGFAAGGGGGGGRSGRARPSPAWIDRNLSYIMHIVLDWPIQQLKYKCFQVACTAAFAAARGICVRLRHNAACVRAAVNTCQLEQQLSRTLYFTALLFARSSLKREQRPRRQQLQPSAAAPRRHEPAD